VVEDGKRVGSDLFHVRVEHDDGCAVVHVSGEVDLAARDDFRRAMDYACCADGTGSVLVDLSEVSYCDSTGINVLLAARREATERHVEMTVMGTSPQVRRVFEMAEVADLLEHNLRADAD
jgi:anti-sigma B factor antagonist